MSSVMMSGGRAKLWWPALVAALGIGVYANTLSNGFALDDVQLVRDDPRIETLRQLPALFLEPYWYQEGRASNLYRPVTVASFAVNRALTGAEPFGFHLVNVLLHGAVCALVYFAARRVGVHYGTALLAGALFAVHPIHTEAVANVAGRAELLAALGVLGAWLCHRRGAEAERPQIRAGWSVGASTAYLLAVLSKESAVAAPVLFYLDERLYPGGAPRTPRSPSSLASRWGGYGFVVVLALALRVQALGGLHGVENATFFDNPIARADTFVRVATALWVHLRYAALVAWPVTLSSDYSFDAVPVVRAATDWRFALGVGFGLAVGAALYTWRRSSVLVLSVAIWVLFLLPTANLLFPTGTMMAERLAYLPSLGACLLAGHLGARVATASGAGRVRVSLVASVSVIVLSILAARSWARNPDWSSTEALALHDVEVYPRSAKLQAGAAIVLHEAGKIPEAETRYRKALAIYPDYAQIHYNLGTLLVAKGARREGMEHLIRAAVLSPQNPRPLQGIARLLLEAGPSDAEELHRLVLAEEALPEPLRREAATRLRALEDAGSPAAPR